MCDADDDADGDVLISIRIVRVCLTESWKILDCDTMDTTSVMKKETTTRTTLIGREHVSKRGDDDDDDDDGQFAIVSWGWLWNVAGECDFGFFCLFC